MTTPTPRPTTPSRATTTAPTPDTREAGFYRITTLRFAYSVIINADADKDIEEVLNENAKKGYVLDRIITNESPHEGHNYIWFMIITRRAR
ncbi:MAG: hypothetical protein ACE5Q6_21520 [Dehalococcoidia bacterium]